MMNITRLLNSSWLDAVPALTDGTVDTVLRRVAERRATETVYPPAEQTFRALQLTPLEKVSVVIIGQDPYHGPKQAHGLCFSVPEPLPAPPSLKNIFKEIGRDLDYEPYRGSTDLTRWAEQGVLLLNTILSVAAGKPGSHAGMGWEPVTDQIIAAVDTLARPVIFCAWGNPAQKKCAHLNTRRHTLLRAPHPSPLSAYRGFLGCGHFSQCNTLLQHWGREPINW
jgi:uracil-DNA glycosylase